MNDTDKPILRAILLTLSAQDTNTVLTTDLVSAFRSFAEDPNASAMVLHRAIMASPLSETYDNIRLYLSGFSAEQSLGVKDPPAEWDDGDDPTIDNMVRRQRKIDADLATGGDKARQVLASNNSIQMAHLSYGDELP